MSSFDWLVALGTDAGPEDVFEPSDEAASPASDLLAHMGTWHPFASVVEPDDTVMHSFRLLVEVHDWDLYLQEKEAYYSMDEDE